MDNASNFDEYHDDNNRTVGSTSESDSVNSTNNDRQKRNFISELVRPYQVQTPARYRRPLAGGIDETAAFIDRPRRAISTNSLSSAKSHAENEYSYHDDININTKSRIASSMEKQIIPMSYHQPTSFTEIGNEKKIKRENLLMKCDFQYNDNASYYEIQHVNIDQRSIFAMKHPMSLMEWRVMAEKASHLNPHKDMHKRLSPSYEYLELINILQKQTVVRQIHFSPSTGIDSEYFCCNKTGMLEVDEDDDYLVDDYLIDKDGNSSHREKSFTFTNTKKLRRHCRVGRYRSIDPVKALMNFLPENIQSPLLSHQKHRIPSRSDVGFPNATEEEIKTKQQEIQWEAAWEESSPSIVIGVTSNDVGVLILDNDAVLAGQNQFNEYDKRNIIVVGRELQLAKERNFRLLRMHDDKKGKNTEYDALPLPRVLQPNPYSMLAPPLDASYSRSKGWRPRAYHDRPPCMSYYVACPMSVNVNTFAGMSSTDNLIGSLTLYQLPTTGKIVSGGNNRKFGKVSELFWFPIGKWKDHNDIGAELHKNGEKTNLESLLKRKCKPIFSYNSFDLMSEDVSDKAYTGKDKSTDSLFIVMQIYSFPDFSSPIKSGTNSFRTSTTSFDESPFLQHMSEASKSHILTPISFGVCDLVSFSDLVELSNAAYLVNRSQDSFISKLKQWPDGNMKEMQLYSFLKEPVSEEKFVEHVCEIICKQQMVSTSSTSRDYSHEPESQTKTGLFAANSNVSSKQPSGTSRMVSKKQRKLGSIMFRSTNKSAKPCAPSPIKTDVIRAPTEYGYRTNETVCGQASLFCSSLLGDFLQSILSNPEWPLKSETARLNLSPKLLVDISGDFAVSLNKVDGVDNFNDDPEKMTIFKRSNLLRLPPSDERAGYAGVAECREILYFPLRPEKHYAFDVPPSYHSLLNLLFLYPRLLRKSGGDEEFLQQNRLRNHPFTIRIRLLNQESVTDESTGIVTSRSHPLKCFYNTSPWGGSGLLDSCFTSINSDFSLPRLYDNKSGFPMKDEVKLSLPHVLEDRYSLEFSLYEVESSSLSINSTSTIPLSSVKETLQGRRIATVIPNGKHRLELGQFQLQFETRLISSLHIGDPSVATLLRDFLPSTREERKVSPISLPPHIGALSSVYESNDLDRSLLSLISSASDSSVLGYFQILANMYLCSLLNVYSKHYKKPAEGKFVLAIKCLLHVIQKVKSKLSSNNSSCRSNIIYDAFFKKFLDTFDEAHISSPSLAVSSECQIMGSKYFNKDSLQLNDSCSQDDENVEEKNEAKSVDLSFTHFHRKSMRNSVHDFRGERIAALVGKSITPFSRVAYGASKLDRMRVEAELEESKHYSHYFDDDETVATSSSLPTWGNRGPRMLSSDNPKSYNETLKTLKEVIVDDNSIVPSADMVSESYGETNNVTEHTDFVKRVKVVAQVMLAPCVGPSLSNILGSRVPVSPEQRAKDIELKFDGVSSCDGVLEVGTKYVCSPGTYDDSSYYLTGPTITKYNQYNRSTETVLREPTDIPTLTLSLIDYEHNMVNVVPGEFIYESIIVLWLKSYIDYEGGSSSSSHSNLTFSTVQSFTSFYFPEDDDVRKISTDTGSLVFCFFLHTDFLLPLCLKSFLLRCSALTTTTHAIHRKVVMDESHLNVMKLFVEMLARGLVGQSLGGVNSSRTNKNPLLLSLNKAKYISEFLIGVAAALHPEQINFLFHTYLRALKDPFSDETNEEINVGHFQFTEESLLFTSRSMQLRLSTIERFAVMPSFLALNYPCRYSDVQSKPVVDAVDWLHQIIKNSSFPMTSLSETYTDGRKRLPPSGWFADLIVNECFSVCSKACQILITESMAQIEASRQSSQSEKKNITSNVTRSDLLLFQSIAIHSLDIVYELIIRRHSMDLRFQSAKCRSRIAALFTQSILHNAVANVKWLAQLETTNQVRSIWLLCVVYILQEAPEVLIREFVKSCCFIKNNQLHRFIRLLRLCSSTFQSFIEMQRRDFQSSQLYKKISPWIVQESFNTISATINIVVEATVCRKSHFLFKELKVLPNIVELYLYLLAMPQTPVTRLRGVGGALHILNQFGIEIFLDITGPSLQHWIRVMLSLMNSISLSVRSIAVDFVVSLLGSSYDMHGNIDVILNVFLTVLPEVVAREVATYAVNGHISCFDDVFKSVWPIRRAIADIEDSNPLDDDRIDPQLAPIVSSFCRASQAIIDGVLIEMRLGGNSITVVGTVIQGLVSEDSLFDADEESLFEAVSNFLPEIAPIQRLRWLFTLKSLHEEKEQWVEAAETLLMCAHTIIESIPYINHAWRPKRFNLWSDERQSTGFGVMGEEVVYHYKENNEVMEFAAAFLDPKSLLGVQWSLVSGGNISIMCCLLELIVTEIVRLYCSDDNLCGLAYNRLESLLNAALAASRNYSSRFCSKSNISGIAASTYTQCVQEHSSLQNVVALISRQVGKLAEFLHPQNVASSEEHTRLTHIGLGGDQYFGNSLVFVVMCLSGVKPSRFTESTSLPAFLEWDTPCICRVPVTSELQNNGILNSSKSICEAFAHRYILALKKECGETNVVLKTDNSVSSNRADTTLEVFLAEIVIMNGVNGRLISPHMSFKQVVYKTNNALVENTIAQAFPCVLSRQRPIMTTRILTSHSNDFHQSK